LLLVLRLVCLVERLFSPVPGRYGLSLVVLYLSLQLTDLVIIGIPLDGMSITIT